MSWSYAHFKQWAIEYGVCSCREILQVRGDGGSLVCGGFNGRIREAWTLERHLEEKERLKGERGTYRELRWEVRRQLPTEVQEKKRFGEQR